MNIVQLKGKVDFWIDYKFAPRFRFSDYEDAINTAISDIVKDRVDNIKQLKPYSFQTIERLRDELFTLVKELGNIVPVGDTISVNSYPADYMYLLNLIVTINGVEYFAIPITYHQLQQFITDPFKRPKLGNPYNVYMNESALGQKLFWGGVGALQSATMQYISAPISVSLGTEITSASPNEPIDVNVISTNGNTMYGSQIYTYGQQFTVLSGTQITTGSAVKGYINQNTPTFLDEEIAKKAANILETTIEDYNKAKAVEVQKNES